LLRKDKAKTQKRRYGRQKKTRQSVGFFMLNAGGDVATRPPKVHTFGGIVGDLPEAEAEPRT
jgi:hypothetical protein